MGLPTLYSLKFIVDGMTRGSPRAARIGRVLRDEVGSIKIMFFKFVE